MLNVIVSIKYITILAEECVYSNIKTAGISRKMQEMWGRPQGRNIKHSGKEFER